MRTEFGKDMLEQGEGGRKTFFSCQALISFHSSYLTIIILYNFISTSGPTSYIHIISNIFRRISDVRGKYRYTIKNFVILKLSVYYVWKMHLCVGIFCYNSIYIQTEFKTWLIDTQNKTSQNCITMKCNFLFYTWQYLHLFGHQHFIWSIHKLLLTCLKCLIDSNFHKHLY